VNICRNFNYLPTARNSISAISSTYGINSSQSIPLVPGSICHNLV